MKKQKRNIMKFMESPTSGFPKWYWNKGLHDAQILSKSFVRYEFNPPPTTPYNNCLTIILDASHAMYDTNIEIIKFYNCKELTPDIDIKNSWWVKDVITKEQSKYYLDIEIIEEKISYIYSVRFEHCEVIRKTRGMGDGFA